MSSPGYQDMTLDHEPIPQYKSASFVPEAKETCLIMTVRWTEERLCLQLRRSTLFHPVFDRWSHVAKQMATSKTFLFLLTFLYRACSMNNEHISSVWTQIEYYYNDYMFSYLFRKFFFCFMKLSGLSFRLLSVHVLLDIIIIIKSNSCSLTLSLSVPIIHRYWQVFKAASSVQTELKYVTICWSANTGTSMSRNL